MLHNKIGKRTGEDLTASRELAYCDIHRSTIPMSIVRDRAHTLALINLRR